NGEVVVKVEKILDEMDVAAPQVALSTVVGQLSLSNDEEFDADYFAKYHNRFVGTSTNNGVFSGNNPGIPATAVMDPSKIINFSKILKNAATGTNVYVAAGDAFAAIVHLLEQTGKFKIISRPTVFTSNNKKAIIVLGGLIEDNKQKNSNGIPYLSRIPYLGAAFRSTKVSVIRTELIVLMRPEVTLTKLDAYRIRQKQEDRTHFGPELEQDD